MIPRPPKSSPLPHTTLLPSSPMLPGPFSPPMAQPLRGWSAPRGGVRPSGGVLLELGVQRQHRDPSSSLRCEMPMGMGKALIEPDHVPPSFQPRSTTLPRRLLLGDLGQVMHYHPPTYPSSHPILTMVGATLQTVLPPKYADASFHAGPEREGPLEPGLFFVLLALLGKTTALRQGHAPDARPLGGLLALLRVESAVAG